VDFSLNADQEALRDLARQILADRCTPEHLKAVAATDTAVDLDLWRTMAAAGLVGIGLPEAAGGGGRGFLDVCIVLEEVARAAAPVPALAVLGLAGPALAHFGGGSYLDPSLAPSAPSGPGTKGSERVAVPLYGTYGFPGDCQKAEN